MTITKEDLKKQSAEIKRHNNTLYENFREDIKTIGEGWDSVKEKTDATFEMVGGLKKKADKMSDKLDATFEMVGSIKVEASEINLKIERLEKEIEIIKSDIAFIKNELKQKVDREEFITLEKRLILLENKFKRV
jgi:chromosome segregation ATPase